MASAPNSKFKPPSLRSQLKLVEYRIQTLREVCEGIIEAGSHSPVAKSRLLFTLRTIQENHDGASNGA